MYFGTDGIRGKAGEFLTSDVAYKLGKILGWQQKEHNGNAKPVRVVIGKDTRKSSYMLEYSLVAGLTSVGADAYLMHVTTTPSVAYITKTENFDYGIMISASHNPYYDNGIKVFSSSGEKLNDSFISKIENLLSSDVNIPFATELSIGKAIDYLVGRSKYCGFLTSVVKDLKGLKVVLDTANGSTYKIAKTVYELLGADVTLIANEPSGVNINKNCGSTHINNLQTEVIKLGADIGFAFDGDGDRCIAVGKNGQVYDGDSIMYLLAKNLHNHGELNGDKIAVTIMSNKGLINALKKDGISCEFTAVGDRFVYEKMKEHSLSLGGENSGHIIICKYLNTGDGILTSLCVCDAILSGGDISKQLKDLYLYPQITESVPVKDNKSVIKDETVKKAILQAEIIVNDGRVLVRASGTEPVVRITAEAKTETECELAVAVVKKAVLYANDNMLTNGE